MGGVTAHRRPQTTGGYKRSNWKQTSLNTHAQHPAPAFLGIGAARSGSTWIFKQLERSPRIWVPRLKELHYFSRGLDQCGPSFLAEDRLIKRLLSSEEHNRDYRQRLVQAIGSNIIKPSLQKLRWDSKYFLAPPSDSWYLDLFQPANDRISGEITPAYSALDDLAVAKVKNLLPNVKIIHILRDPVDRAWSLLRYHEQREGEAFSSQHIEAMWQRVMHRNIVQQSDYAAVLKRWELHFDETQRFVGFYDEIQHSPNELLQRLFDFLELDEQPNSSISGTNSKVNSSFEKEMPVELQRKLAAHYQPMVEDLAKTRESLFVDWAERYEKILGNN